MQIEQLKTLFPNVFEQMSGLKDADFMPRLLEFIGNHRLVFFGEIHGTKEIPNLMVPILAALKSKGFSFFALEVPRNNMDCLTEYLKSGKIDDLAKLPHYQGLLHPNANPGINSKQHLAMVHSAHKLGYTLAFFDIVAGSVSVLSDDEREKIFAKNLLELWGKAGQPRGVVFCGGGHNYNYESKRMANIVGKNADIITISFVAGQGQNWNFRAHDIAEIDPTGSLLSLALPDINFAFFDARLDLGKSNARNILKSDGIIYLKKCSVADLPTKGFLKRLFGFFN